MCFSTFKVDIDDSFKNMWSSLYSYDGDGLSFSCWFKINNVLLISHFGLNKPWQCITKSELVVPPLTWKTYCMYHRAYYYSILSNMSIAWHHQWCLDQKFCKHYNYLCRLFMLHWRNPNQLIESQMSGVHSSTAVKIFWAWINLLTNIDPR